ncbi:hypothetical protein [Sphaerimonospora mesophila]|uniref:hypothetical protein n=1 Tax=Sphaerimonospora mesophila TaxID=37483 RepID=UPI0006E19CB5
MRANVPLRIARSATFSAVCVLLAVGAHWFAGGAGPTPRILLVGWLAVMAAATALAGRQRSPETIIGLVLAAQVLLHQMLGPARRPGVVPHPPVAHDPAHELGLYEHGEPLSVRAGMLVAHLTAALITGWWLSRGEALVWSILRRIGVRAVRWFRPLLGRIGAGDDVVPRPRSRGPEPVLPGCAVLLRHAVIRRGPPGLLLS